MKNKIVNLSSEFDANIWAEEFVRIFTKTRLLRSGIDVDTMRAWFANSIMAGYDHRRWGAEKERDALREQNKQLINGIFSTKYKEIRELAGEMLVALKKYWIRPDIAQEVIGDLIDKAEAILGEKGKKK